MNSDDAIRRTKKQWHAEKIKKQREMARSLAEMPQDFPRATGNRLMQIMEGLMQTLSERQSRLLQHLEARYDWATRATVERMLSEFTMAMTDLPNISDRMNSWLATFETSQIASELDMMDRWAIEAYVSTLATAGVVQFTVRRGYKGIQITASQKGEQLVP